MNSHQFIPTQSFINTKQMFRIKCKETGQEFSSAAWERGAIEENCCLCCGQTIHKRRKKK